jgi:hypothetical protein
MLDWGWIPPCPLAGAATEVEMDVIRYLSDEGTPLQALPFSHDELLRGYRALRRARFWDDRAEVLQRQGKLSATGWCRRTGRARRRSRTVCL